ncbi:hypothetical protein F5Y19DRAFT_490167 [Xylariaceae sp. FL1651]|nr:hypothetical protein F5Y19DRAFT_490167 [Xylariaceae sp. FL1651]
MADLRFIMDVEEDGDPEDHKYSGKPGHSGLAHSLDSSSSTKRSDDNLRPSNAKSSKSQQRRRGPLSRSSRSTTTASSTTATASTAEPSSSRSPLAQKARADSTASMDSASYRNYDQNLSSANMPPSNRPNGPQRPLSGAAGESNMPVKLTPITGRVSRAKKGVPVHTCDVCKPPKTFTRAEHLRRHQLSHKPASFQCPYTGCGKTFHRQDLLTRHIQRHEQDAKSVTDPTGGTSRRPSYNSTEGNPPTMSFPPPMLPGNAMPLGPEITPNPGYTGSTSSYPTSHQGGSSTRQTPMSPSGHSHRSHSVGASQELNYVLSPTHVPPYGTHPSSMDGSPFQSASYGLGFQPRRSPPFTYVGLEGSSPHLPTLTIPNNNIPDLLPYEPAWASSASDSPYSAHSSQDRAVIRGFGSPVADMAESQFFVTYPSPQQAVYHPASAIFPEETSFYDFHSSTYPVRSPTPPTVTLSAQPAENLVTLGHSVPAPQAILGSQKASAALLGPYSGAVFLTAALLSPATLKAVPHYLDVYWKRFDTLFPLVNRRSLETDADGVLRYAMAAMGSQFLQGEEDRIHGDKLHAFAWQEARRYSQWSIQVMQSILLCEFYARFRGLRAMTRPSEPFQSLYSRDRLFSLVLSPSSKPWHPYSTSSSQVANSQFPDDHGSSTTTTHQHWDKWIITESSRRLLAACFVLDRHASIYHEHSPMHPFTTPIPPIPLTKPTERLWAAQNREAWEVLVASDPTQLESVSLADVKITADRIATAPPLDLAVYLASEALRLPRRSSPSTLDLSTEVNLASTARLCDLFSGYAVANTYLALHYTPLRDLLAVSGDSWLFSKKILKPEAFQRQQINVKQWSSSVHAGAASLFAAKALLAFLVTNNTNTPNTDMSRETDVQGRKWNMSDISDYWALYVCALVFWAISYRTTGGAMVRRSNNNTGSSASSNNVNTASEKAEREALGWLKTVASLSPEAAVQSVRGRREAHGIIGMVRRRLEDETAGSRNQLLVDAAHVLKNLEENPSKGRF